jgi:hypothetical protein
MKMEEIPAVLDVTFGVLCIFRHASASTGQTNTAEIRAHNVEHPNVVMVVDEEINPTFGMNVSVIANNATGSLIPGSVGMGADVTSDSVLLATVTMRADGDPTAPIDTTKKIYLSWREES